MTSVRFSKEFIDRSDLYLAYRKAKSEAFFDGLHPNALAFAEFERNLKSNLDELYQRLNHKKPDWPSDIDLIGGYLYIPKSVDESKWEDLNRIHLREVDPVRDWEQRFSRSGKRLEANYRLIIAPTVSYQIISALWILKVGHLFESKLDKRLSYGNRLRRSEPSPFAPDGTNGELNIDSLGLFTPYFSAYQSWRENGLAAMSDSVKKQKAVSAITMDLTGFYHNVSPRFLLRRAFLNVVGVELTGDERRFTNQLIESIDCWYKSTPDSSVRPEGALPVGLSASKVISNILLYQLDQEINQNLSPIYYGRYVDDIFLVVENVNNETSGKGILKWLAKSIPCLKVKFKKGEDPELKLDIKSASDSHLYFTANKQKIFNLSSLHGLDLVDQISAQIKVQSSEYRMLPDLPETASGMATKALLATPDASLAADALRKADVVSVKRLGFSLLFKDIDSYSTDLSRAEWENVRFEFYGLVNRYLLTPMGLFDFPAYFPRIFSLMVSNHDFKHAHDFISSLSQCFELINRTTFTKDRGERFNLCKSYFEKSLRQAALQASTTKKFEEFRALGRLLRELFKLSGSFRIPSKAPSLAKVSEELLLSDWGRRPYKDYWYYEQSRDLKNVRPPRSLSIQRVIRLGAIRKFREAAELKMPHWPALAFPTRPLTVQEIALITPRVLEDPLLFKTSIKGLRGAGLRKSTFVGAYHLDDDKYFNAPHKSKDKVVVALTNVQTTKEQWEKAAKSLPDRSLERYNGLCCLVNNILKSDVKPDYVVFPECSVPRRWAIGFAAKLARQGISLLCGTEYYKHKKSRNQLRNDCLVSLATRWPGYNSNLIYMQPKLAPSHGEKKELSDLGEQQFLPTGGVNSFPIYNHGGFFFGVLICSDLTNPANRVRYQGKVDGLFVLEWNKDVKTFNFLVEGAAHDIHTFVVQVNNRLYGDSRIRAPYRAEYLRDSVRIKGGKSDYHVLGEIDYISLRKFQKENNMANDKSTFKPVPIGFEMSRVRKDVT